MTTRAPLRLRTSALTVLLGDDDARRSLLAQLDEDSARCRDGHGVAAVSRMTLDRSMPASQRAQVVAGQRGLAVLLADRPTVGLDDAGRRTVLQALRSVARTGTAVLVDDVDPVAALAVADGALRVGADGSVGADDLGL
jgi:ABC-type hemin transport system ATPase subunit